MSLVRWKKDELPPHPSETTLAAVGSLAIPLVQEVVFFVDFRCPRCQGRVAEIISKMNGETQSVVISVMEKKFSSCGGDSRDAFFVKYHIFTRQEKVGEDDQIKNTVKATYVWTELDSLLKMKRIILRMKEIETHMIEKQQNKVSVSGRFIPADVAIKIRKKMKRRVEILEIQELEHINGHVEEMPPPVVAQPT